MKKKFYSMLSVVTMVGILSAPLAMAGRANPIGVARRIHGVDVRVVGVGAVAPRAHREPERVSIVCRLNVVRVLLVVLLRIAGSEERLGRTAHPARVVDRKGGSSNGWRRHGVVR